MEYVLSGESVLQREDGTFTLVKDFFKDADMKLVESDRFRTKDGSILCNGIKGAFVRECFQLKTVLGDILVSGCPVESAVFDFEGFDKDAGFSAQHFLKGVLFSHGLCECSNQHYIQLTRNLCCEFSELLNSLNIEYDFRYFERDDMGSFDFEYAFDNCDENIFSCDTKARWSFLLGFLRFGDRECRHYEKDTMSFIRKVAATLHATLKVEDGHLSIVTKENKESELSNRVDSQKIVLDKVYLLTFGDSAGTDIELWVDGFYVKLKK